MTSEERDKYRTVIYNIAREAYSEYVDDDTDFPECYDAARQISQFNPGNMLAQFVAMEIWEVMEGHETLAECRNEAIIALQNACDEINGVIAAIGERNAK